MSGRLQREETEMHVSDIFFAAVRLAEDVRRWAREISAELRCRVLALKSRPVKASAKCGWLRGLRRQSRDCRYVATYRRGLGFEGLEARALLTGVVTFVPGAYMLGGVNVWTTSHSATNWDGQYGLTYWSDGDTAQFTQAAAMTVDVSGTVAPLEIQFAGGGSTTLNQYSSESAISLYETNNNLVIDDLHPEHPDQNVVTNDFINCPITAPTGSTGALVKEDPGAIAIGSTGNSPPGGVLLEGGSITIGHNTFASTATITVDTATGAGSAALAIYDTSSSSVTISNNFVFQAGDLRVDTRGYQVTFSGSLTSPPAPDPTGSLVISDTAANGTFTATDTSNFRGNVTIISGSLVLTGGATIGTGNMIINGGRLDLGSTDYVPPATLSFLSGDIAASSAGYIDLSTPGTTFTTDIQAGEDGFISAPIEGSGNLEVGAPVGGSGLLFLLGDDTWTGTTTIDTGASLIYRWNGRNGEYSIPGGYGTAVVQTGATLKSEYAYLTQINDPNAYIWNGDSNGIWENDNNNTDWYGYIATDPLVDEGPAAVFWVGSGRDAVFEEPVPGGTTPTGQWSDIMIEGLVQLDGHLTFMMRSNVIISSGGTNNYLSVGNFARTLIDCASQNTTQCRANPGLPGKASIHKCTIYRLRAGASRQAGAISFGRLHHSSGCHAKI